MTALDTYSCGHWAHIVELVRVLIYNPCILFQVKLRWLSKLSLATASMKRNTLPINYLTIISSSDYQRCQRTAPWVMLLSMREWTTVSRSQKRFEVCIFLVSLQNTLRWLWGFWFVCWGRLLVMGSLTLLESMPLSVLDASFFQD